MKKFLLILIPTVLLLAQSPVRIVDLAGTQLINKSSLVSAAAQTSLGATAAQLKAANADRKSLFIQNTGTTVIKIVLGTGTPTQTVYHIALKAGTASLVLLLLK